MSSVRTRLKCTDEQTVLAFVINIIQRLFLVVLKARKVFSADIDNNYATKSPGFDQTPRNLRGV